MNTNEAVNAQANCIQVGQWGQLQGYYPAPPKTAHELIAALKCRAEELRRDLAQVDAKRAELDQVERMLASAEK